MTSAERALLNAPRQSSLSSQMAAITAAADRDDSPSPPSGGGGSKGKLDQMKMETEIKQEDGENDTGGGGSYGGKNIKNEMNSLNIKQEIKTEPMEENGVTIKEEPGLIKEEPGLAEASADIKPSVDANNVAGAASGEPKHKSK